MVYDPEKHQRRSIRLKGYDYTQAGAYFITICTQDRACLFGEVVDGELRLDDAGQMACAAWNALPQRFPTIELDAFVVMPNHVHGIIVIAPSAVGAGLVPAPNAAPNAVAPANTAIATGATTRVAPTIGGVVGAFKSWTTVLYTRGVRQSGWSPFHGRVWQRNYFEHVIRNEESLNRIRQYIVDNPLCWSSDRENPSAVPPEPEDACLA